MTALNKHTCGECHFGRFMSQDFTKRVCWGVPPTPIVAPDPRTGQMGIQTARAIVDSNDECALWRKKEEPIHMGSDAQVIRSGNGG